MFKIGDFSKICQVSIKTLRHWDEVGLLAPAHVDKFTNYRYYDVTQMQQVNRILAYKGLGLSLKEIKRLLDEDLDPTEIRGMLKLKQAELRQELKERQAMLLMVETRLKQIEREGGMPEDEAVIKSVDPLTVVTIRERTPTMNDLVRLLHQTHQAHAKHDGIATTPLFAVFHDDAYYEAMIDVEVSFGVADARLDYVNLSDDKRMAPAELLGMELVASTVHSGPWFDLANGYGLLGNWIGANGYEITGPAREVFHKITWEPRPIHAVTEVQFPVQRNAIST